MSVFKNIGRIWGAYVLIAFLNFLLFIGYLKWAELPGGQVGMIPLALLLISGISFFIATVIVLLGQFKFSIDLLTAVFIYHLVYFGILFSDGFYSDITNNIGYDNTSLFIVLIGLLVGVLVSIGLKFITRRK